MSQISITLSPDQLTRYKRMAAKQKLSLSKFLTDRVEYAIKHNDQILTERRQEEYLARILSLTTETLRKVTIANVSDDIDSNEPEQVLKKISQSVKEMIEKKYD